MHSSKFTKGTVAFNGMSCKLPDALLNSIAAVSKFSSQSGFEGDRASFKDALRANMVAGGDSCSRAVVIGAFLGAQVRSSLCARIDRDTTGALQA